jgi:undecaprenyl phosphate-alpha-L-ara4N flippase subunit ArnF
MRYLFIFATLLLTVYGQIIIKWRISVLKFQLPDGDLMKKAGSLVKLVFDPLIFSGFLAAFVASLTWMAAMSKFEITQAYPFMSLAPAIVFVLGIWLLNETFTWGKVIGLIFIIVGIIITVKY